MPSLSQETIDRVRDILLRCREFDSDRALRAVFVTDELAPFCDGLPQASSRIDRVDQCIAYLVDKVADGKIGLFLLLETLRDKYHPDDSLRQELTILLEPVATELSDVGLLPTPTDVKLEHPRYSKKLRLIIVTIALIVAIGLAVVAAISLFVPIEASVSNTLDCGISASEITLGKDVIEINKTTSVTVHTENPAGRSLLFNWRATNGEMNPGLRTNSAQSTYTAPSNPINDTVHVEIISPGCDSFKLSKQISVILATITETPTLSPTNTSSPTFTSTATTTPTSTATSTSTSTPTTTPTATGTATTTPTPRSLMVESFERRNDSSLSEDFKINRNAKNEGTLRLVGIPHINDGVQAVAFEFEILHSTPGDYIGFDREFPPQDWSSFSFLCLWLEPDGSNRTLVVQFGESIGHFWKKTQSLATLDTGDYCISFQEVEKIDLRAIGYYGLYVEGPPPGESVIYIDSIRVVEWYTPIAD